LFRRVEEDCGRVLFTPEHMSVHIQLAQRRKLRKRFEDDARHASSQNNKNACQCSTSYTHASLPCRLKVVGSWNV
jgi:hypothetical protein